MTKLLSHLCASVFICGLLSGCMGGGTTASRPAMFEPTQMRINPTFTRFRSFDGEGSARGIEADVELRDGFDDATKGAGAIYFELFEYLPQGADARGARVGEPARYDLSTIGAQQRYWQNIVRTYRFRLPWQGLDPQQRYVLSATYLPPEGSAGERLFDRLVILPVADGGE